MKKQSIMFLLILFLLCDFRVSNSQNNVVFVEFSI